MVGAFLLGLVSVCLTQALDETNKLKLSVAGVPFGPDVAEIVLGMRSGETTASCVLYLRQTGDKPLSDVSLFVLVGGRPAQVSFGGQKSGVWTIPGRGSEVTVTLTWNENISSASLEGELIATVSPKHLAIAKVRVTKSTAAPLRLLEATPLGIKLTTPRAAFQHRFHLVSDVDHDVRDVQIAVEPLLDSSSQQVVPAVQIDGAAYDGAASLVISRRATKPFTLRAELTSAGVHRGALAVRWPGGETSVSLEFNRTEVPASLVVENIANVRKTLGDNEDWSAKLRVVVRETEGHRLVLAPPILLSLTKKFGTDEAQVGGATLSVENANAPLGPRESRALQISVGKLEEPGEYTGTFRFVSGDALPIDKVAKIHVRHSGLYAGLLIAAGTLASSLLRWFLTTRKSQLVLQRRAIDIGEQLERVLAAFAPLGEREGQLAQSMRVRAGWILRQAATETKATAEASSDEFERKLPILTAWLRIRMRFAGGALPSSVRSKLLVIEQFLERWGTTAADATTQSTAAQDLEREVDALPSLSDVIALLRRQVDEKGPGFGNLPELVDVRALLRKASAAVADGNREKGAAELRKAQGGWRQLLVTEMSAILTTQPQGIDQDHWRRVVAQAEAHFAAAKVELSHDEAMEEYHAGVAIALGGLTDGLDKAIDELRQSATTPEIESLAAEVVAFRADLHRVLTEGGDPTDLLERYRTVAECLNREGQRHAGRGFRNVPPHSLVVPEQTGFLDDVFVLDPVNVPPFQAPSRASVNWQIYAGDMVVTGVLLTIAVFLGLQLLYLPNATWGSTTDGVTAVLWGLGLHEIGNTSFQGLRGLRTTFGATAV